MKRLITLQLQNILIYAKNEKHVTRTLIPCENEMVREDKVRPPVILFTELVTIVCKPRILLSGKKECLIADNLSKMKF